MKNGCKPTKTMVASAYAAWLAREAHRFGVSTGPATVDILKVHERKKTVVKTAWGKLTSWMESTPGITLVRGHARFS